MAARATIPKTPRPESRFENVISCLGAIESLYESLDALRPRQRELIDAEDAAPLLDVLAERDRIVRELQRADELLQDQTSAWENQSPAPSPRERDVARLKMESLSRLASKIAADDEEDNLRLVRRRGVIAAQLSGLSNSRAATTAYGHPTGGPRFQDREV